VLWAILLLAYVVTHVTLFLLASIVVIVVQVIAIGMMRR
jgi:hypothetical protein